MSYTATWYAKRKETGLCMRCNRPAFTRPNGTKAVMCWDHMLKAKEYYQANRIETKSDKLAYTGPDERRVPVAPLNFEALPPLPRACPRCKARTFGCYTEGYFGWLPAVHCLMCGYVTDQLMLQNILEQRVAG